METIGYTFARLDGLAVVIHEDDVHSAHTVRVRYCGPKGKAIIDGVFFVQRHELAPF